MASHEEFIKNIKALERLRTNHNFSKTLYENGKYIMFLKGDRICVDGIKLAYRNYKDILELKKFGSWKTFFLCPWVNLNIEECLFAVDLDMELNDDKVEEAIGGKFVEVRTALFFLELQEGNYVKHARGLINFDNTTNYCCHCGGKLKVKEGGYLKKCLICKASHYPNLSPVGLTLIEDDDHKEVLLVRQKRHPPGFYTCIAGFIEPGESLEDNVRREVAEEVGLSVQNVEYITSQHWALPTSQLTLGCFATTKEKDIEADPKEIIDAKWVKADELKEAILRVKAIRDPSELDGKELYAPPYNAVSHFLMMTWLRRYHNFNYSSSSK